MGVVNMDAEANRAMALEFLRLMAAFEFDAMFELMADDASWRVVGDPETFPPAGTLSKPERRAMFDGFVSVLKSLEFDIASTTAEGDRVAVEFTCRGESHEGPVYENEFINLFRFRDGKIIGVYELCGQQAVLAFGHELEQHQEGQDIARITYIEASGAEHAVAVEAGLSVMQGAVENGIPGILADCGGSASCGTCRVYVAEEWRAITGQPSDDEEAMLALHNDDTRPGQRLSCQIEVTDELDGLIVDMPARQF